MSVLTRFRLDGGTNQQAARKLLPTEGLLRRVQNMRLRRDNELAVRPGFSAFAATVYGGSPTSLVAFDVFSFDERLFALGNGAALGGTALGLYEYVDEARAWRPISLDLPRSTGLREVGAPPDQAGGVATGTVAARGGYVLLVWTDGANAYGHMFRASDDATLRLQLLTKRSAVALVTEAGLFVAVEWTSGGHLFAQAFNPASSTSFSSATSLQNNDSEQFCAAAVLGAPGGYVTAGTLSGDIVVSWYDDSHVQQMTRTITGVVPNSLSVHANGPKDRLVIAYGDNADGACKTWEIVLSTGADISGPDTVTAEFCGLVSVRYEDPATTGFWVLADLLSTTPKRVELFGGSTVQWKNAHLSTDLAIGIDGLFQTFFGGFLWGGDDDQRVNAMAELPTNAPQWFKDFGTAEADASRGSGSDPAARLGGLCRDAVTGLWYSTSFALNNDLERGVTVNEWSTARVRRQVAVAGNLLHLSGALPLTFDGRNAFESGFGEAPVIDNLASSNGAGSITSSAEYFIQVAAEWLDSRRNVVHSTPSIVYSITTGASDDTITGTVRGLHSLRARADALAITSFRLVIFRTAALVDKSAGENLFRETSGTVFPANQIGDNVSFTLTASDDDLRALGATQGTIYTQGQTAIPDQAPPPCRYLWPTNERLAAAGLPRTEQWIQSKLRFPGEAIAFADSDLPEFQGNADEAILGIAALSGSLVAFTRKTISLWQGEGPDFTGQGAFSFAGLLGKEGGLKGWESLCETDDGVFFQRDDDQICMLSKHGAVDWSVGQAVRDELATYPNVKAAVHLRREHAVAFAVQNDAGDAGELLVFDLRRKQWFIDDVLAIALAEYQGRLVYVDTSGVCHYQAASPGSGAMPSQNFETFDFDFGAGLGWGDIIGVGIVGTKVADCVGTLDVTYDSGASYTTIGSWTLSTANGYASGGLLQLKKAPPLRRCARFGLRFNVTGGSDTEGVRVNEITLETEAAPGMARLPVRDTQ